MRTIINNLSLAACFALILTVLTGVTSPLYAQDLFYKQHNLRNPYLCEVTMTPSTEILPQLYFL